MGTSFSFSYLPDEDRVVLFCPQGESTGGFEPILITRRLVKLLGGYLSRYLEKHTEMPRTMRKENKDEFMQFMHQSALENNLPKSGVTAPLSEKTRNHRLATRIDIRDADKKVTLTFYDGDVFLLAMTLGWKKIHSFVYALAQLSKKADWALNDVFVYSRPSYGGPVEYVN